MIAKGGVLRRGLQLGALVATAGLGVVLVLSVSQGQRARAEAQVVQALSERVHQLLTVRDGLADHGAAEGSFAATGSEAYGSLLTSARHRLDAALTGLDQLEGDSATIRLARDLAHLIRIRLETTSGATINGRRLADVANDQAIHATLQGFLYLQEEALRRAQAGLAHLNAQSWRLTLAALACALVLGASLGALAWRHLRERTRAERALADAWERAEEATRAKSAFLATMSHEIRTPMNGVLGMAELLLQEPLAPAQREMVDTIHRSGSHLLGVLNDILDFSKVEAGKLTLEAIPFEPIRASRDVVTLLRASAEAKGLELVFEADAGTPAAVRGDPGRVRQILTNFVGNAIKFTADGEVRVTVGPLPGGEGIRLAVADTGIGIPADRLEAVFDKFTQADSSTSRRFGGTGLGLAICRQLADLMGGRVGVASVEGRGSTFWCELPLAVVQPPIREADAAAPERPDGGAAPGSRCRALVADDNAVNRAVARAMLIKLGCAVDLVEDGAEAVARVAAGGYDIVFMDCQMPVQNGLDATRAIRALPAGRGALPVIALTASVTEADTQECYDAGMDAVVGKPMTMDDLRVVLAERLGVRT